MIKSPKILRTLYDKFRKSCSYKKNECKKKTFVILFKNRHRGICIASNPKLYYRPYLSGLNKKNKICDVISGYLLCDDVKRLRRWENGGTTAVCSPYS